MPDLTIEMYAVCQPYADWAQASPKFRKAAGLKEPKCQYNQYNSGTDPKETTDGKVCPCCGGSITFVKYAV